MSEIIPNDLPPIVDLEDPTIEPEIAEGTLLYQNQAAGESPPHIIVIHRNEGQSNDVIAQLMNAVAGFFGFGGFVTMIGGCIAAGVNPDHQNTGLYMLLGGGVSVGVGCVAGIIGLGDHYRQDYQRALARRHPQNAPN